MAAIKIVLCYAHEDKSLLNKLETHLKPLCRQELIAIWHDQDISAGTKWKREIMQQLNEADVILLLISPDFLGSDYYYSVEMQSALKRHEERKAHVIPIILRPSGWKKSPLGELQALPTNGESVTTWPNQDEAFQNIIDGILKVIEKLPSPNRIALPATSSNPLETEQISSLTISPVRAGMRDERMAVPMPYLKNTKLRVIVTSIVVIFIVSLITLGVFEIRNKPISSAYKDVNAITSPTPAITPVAYRADWSAGINGWIGGTQWSVSGGMLQGKGDTTDPDYPDYLMAPYQPTTPNYIVETQIQFLRPTNASAAAVFGIVVRGGANPNNIGYECYVINKQAKIRVATGANSAVLKVGPFDPGTSWHTYLVEVKGNTFTFFGDNIMLTPPVNDMTYSNAGMVGLLVSNSQINVRSFTVSYL